MSLQIICNKFKINTVGIVMALFVVFEMFKAFLLLRCFFLGKATLTWLRLSESPDSEISDFPKNRIKWMSAVIQYRKCNVPA